MDQPVIHAKRTRGELIIQLGGVGVAVVWVVASLGQEASWLYLAPSAITCATVQFPASVVSMLATTVLVVVASGLFHLKIRSRPGRPEQAGAVIAGLGLGLTAAIGFAPTFFYLLFIASTQGPGYPPTTPGVVVGDIFVLGVFVVLPSLGMVAILLRQSDSVGTRLTSAQRDLVSFAVAAGGSVAWLTITYLAVASNCQNFRWMLVPY